MWLTNQLILKNLIEKSLFVNLFHFFPFWRLWFFQKLRFELRFWLIHLNHLILDFTFDHSFLELIIIYTVLNVENEVFPLLENHAVPKWLKLLVLVQGLKLAEWLLQVRVVHELFYAYAFSRIWLKQIVQELDSFHWNWYV